MTLFKVQWKHLVHLSVNEIILYIGLQYESYAQFN